MVERRRVPRFMFGGPAELCLSPDAPPANVTIRKISMGGCSVEGPGIPEVGQKCELVFKWQDKEFRSEVEVVLRISKREAGLKFLSMDEARLAVLNKLCASLHLEPPPQIPSGRAAMALKPDRKPER